MNVKHGDYVKLANNKIMQVVEKNGIKTLNAPFEYNGNLDFYQAGCWGGPIVEKLLPDKKPPHWLRNPRGYFEFFNMLDTWKDIEKFQNSCKRGFEISINN